jgi:predicted flavoprotein YhiN
MFSEEALLIKLEKSKAKSINDKLKIDLALNNTAIQILKNHLSKEAYSNYVSLSQAIKHLPLKITAAAPIDEAISTTGGIDLEAIDENFQLKQMPQHYCIGEMLDWNAPTGGYLLQACFSMGVKLARHLNGQAS